MYGRVTEGIDHLRPEPVYTDGKKVGEGFVQATLRTIVFADESATRQGAT